MQKKGSRRVYAPSDLSTFLRSPFASWMDRHALEYPGAIERDPRTEEGELLLRRGRQHEASVLAAFREQGRDVVIIDRGPRAVNLTRKAIADGREIIGQAALAAGLFAGYADFLLRGDSGYVPLEAKLARRPKPADIVQVCCYAELLARGADALPAGHGPPAADAVPSIALALGSGETVTLPTADFIYYYEALKRAFLEFMERWDSAAPPVPEAGGEHRPWQRHAEAVLRDLDHPSLVAGMTAHRTRRLAAAGVDTLRQLAASPALRVPGINAATLLRLSTQARLQLAAPADGPPPFEVLPPEAAAPRRGLALLPPASTLDVYFDMEGFPLGRVSLEYLFGATFEEPAGTPRFSDWWAHDGAAEKRAFERFIDWVVERFRRDPGMHVYHYAAYEVSALKRLMGRHGSRESEMDLLLGAEVFVDLYQVVHTGLIVGAPSYSIKHIERLYRPPRGGDVGTAVDSIVFYQRFLDSGEPGDWQASPILRQIRDYNRDDCDSTLDLTRWLRSQAAEHGIAWAGRARDARLPAPAQAAADEDRGELTRRLAAAGSAASVLLGHLLEFHRREDRPMWWAMFDRHEMAGEDLIEDVNCLGGLRRGAPDPPPAGNLRRFRYDFDPEQDTKLRPGSRCFFAHDLNVTLTVAELDLERGTVTIELKAPALERIGAPPDRLALIPSEWVPTDPLRKSIEHTARRYLDGAADQPALDDFLERRAPRFVAEAALCPGDPLVRDDESPGDAVLRLAPLMDRTTLMIQGPPGSGKTTTAARTIVDLLDRGQTVGITSNSHTAIVNLMRACAALREGRLPCMKVGGPRDPELFDACEGAEHCRASRDAAGMLRRLPLVGGTAWLFSRPDLQGKLDYLFVDEAGQVSVANLVGMARASANLVLVGDPMQLPQPVQGAHPGASGASTLDYFLGDPADPESGVTQTVPADRGVFLGTTYRLHPDLCALISAAFYDGRLRPAPATANRVVRVPAEAGPIERAAGVVFVPVIHEGNTQASSEEVQAVCDVVRALCGRERTDREGRPAGIVGSRDILVVAPYNLQVRKLQQALPPGVRAGTVDKFQGQEAPVVILTLCASEGHGSPRGVEFLLNPNRLNVALSRAESLAVVVAHPGLARTACSNVEQLRRVNLLCRIFAAGRTWEFDRPQATPGPEALS